MSPPVAAATIGPPQDRRLSRSMGRSASRVRAGKPKVETEELLAAAVRKSACVESAATVLPVLVLAGTQTVRRRASTVESSSRPADLA